MSVNVAWKGKRFKTQAYKDYELKLLFLLPKMGLPRPPYHIIFEFGFSNKASDLDNPVKQTMDILTKKYSFNDRDVYRLNVTKYIVPKGSEYIKFEINSL